jgi:hypothetical protein
VTFQAHNTTISVEDINMNVFMIGGTGLLGSEAAREVTE